MFVEFGPDGWAVATIQARRVVRVWAAGTGLAAARLLARRRLDDRGVLLPLTPEEEDARRDRGRKTWAAGEPPALVGRPFRQ